MADKTGIAWARSSWSPWIGCTRISPGCDHCYAAVSRPAQAMGIKWGAGVPRHRTSASYWKQPLKWNRQAAEEREIGLAWEHGPADRPGFWPVFPSLCDPFDNEVPVQWRIDFMRLIVDTPNLTWLLLTKRIGNAASMLETAFRAVHHQREGWSNNVPPNVWIGASIVNQEEADRDIPKLLAVPAAKRFVSYEPALGPVDFACVRREPSDTDKKLGGLDRVSAFWTNPLTGLRGVMLKDGQVLEAPNDIGPRIDQIIVGGESSQGGAKARPFDIEWARSTVRQCKAAGVSVFVKQLGSNAIDTALRDVWCNGGHHYTRKPDDPLIADALKAPGYSVTEHKASRIIRDRAGADPAEWPEDLRVQEFPR